MKDRGTLEVVEKDRGTLELVEKDRGTLDSFEEELQHRGVLWVMCSHFREDPSWVLPRTVWASLEPEPVAGVAPPASSPPRSAARWFP